MKQYHNALQHILEHGEDVNDRTGVGTKSVFGYQMRFNLEDGFPAVTTKRLAWKSVVGELIWFLEGSTDERRLAEITHGADRTELVGKSTIWTANADKQGKDLGHRNNDLYKGLGPVYGAQWRSFGKKLDGGGYTLQRGFDQIEWILNEIRTNPDSRRLILSAWNPPAISEMALPPCHFCCQFRIYNNRLNCMLTMRSNDLFLGAPFNMASYALLTHIIARETNFGVGELIYSIGDAHIYKNHITQVYQQLNRVPYDAPTLVIDPEFNLSDVLSGEAPLDVVDKFMLENYNYHSKIEASMAV